MTKNILSILLFLVFTLQSVPDYIKNHWPETSILRQRHLAEPSSSWCGLLFDSATRRKCDYINYYMHALVEGGDKYTCRRDQLGALLCLPCPSQEEDEGANLFIVYLSIRAVLSDQPENIQGDAVKEMYQIVQQLKQTAP